MKKVHVKIDSRNRICLTKVSRNLAKYFYAYERQGNIVLEPVIEVPAEEAWLFAPENKEILKRVKEGLKQKGTISRGSFAKYVKKAK
jgi:hypothetical protein